MTAEAAVFFAAGLRLVFCFVFGFELVVMKLSASAEWLSCLIHRSIAATSVQDD